jgi:hypothetical protein
MVKIDDVNLLYLRCMSNPKVEFIIVNPTSIVDAHVVDHYIYTVYMMVMIMNMYSCS